MWAQPTGVKGVDEGGSTTETSGGESTDDAYGADDASFLLCYDMHAVKTLRDTLDVSRQMSAKLEGITTTSIRFFFSVVNIVPRKTNSTVSSTLREMFGWINEYVPRIEEQVLLYEPMVGKLIPAAGKVDPCITVTRPDGRDDHFGWKIIDEPSLEQSDPVVLNAHLRSLSKPTDAVKDAVGAHSVDRRTCVDSTLRKCPCVCVCDRYRRVTHTVAAAAARSNSHSDRRSHHGTTTTGGAVPAQRRGQALSDRKVDRECLTHSQDQAGRRRQLSKVGVEKLVV